MSRKNTSNMSADPFLEEDAVDAEVTMSPEEDTERAESLRADETQTTVPVPYQNEENGNADKKEEEEEEETLLFSGICPLCWKSDIVNPVLLHGTAARRGGSRDTVLVACRTCAENWAPALTCPNNGGDALFACPFCAHALDVAQPAAFEALTSGEKLKSMRFCNPMTSIDGKPTLFSLAAAKERNSAPCGICEASGATTMCVQCDFALCDGCKKATHSKGKFKEHELLPFDIAQKRQLLKCPVHPSHTLDLFCQTCAESVCISCCFGGDAHKGHDVAQLPEVAATATEELRGVLHTLHNTAKAAEKVQRNVTDLLPSFENCLSTVQADIERSFSALRGALTVREQELLKTLNETRRDRRADIDACIAVGGCLSAQLAASSAAMEEAVGATDAVTLLRLRDTFTTAAAAMDASTTALLRRIQGAQAGLRARLDASDLSSSPIASFYLLSPQESSDVAVKKYKEVLQTMGQLSTASQLATTKPRQSTAPAVAAKNQARVAEDEESQQDDERETSRSQSKSVVRKGSNAPTPAVAPVVVVKAPPLPPRLTATAEEAPRPQPQRQSVDVPRSRWPSLGSAGVGSESETFRFAPLQTTGATNSVKSPVMWGSSAAAASWGLAPASEPIPPPLSLDLAFGPTRRTEAHALPSGSQRLQTPPRGWDAGLKLGTKRFAALDVNQDISVTQGFPQKRARLSQSRDETSGSGSTAQPTASTTSGLQLRL